jgi:hypothetical protein
MTKPLKPTTIDGTKARRPHAHPAKTPQQIADERRAEEAAREQATYGDLLTDIKYLQRKFPINREGALIRVGGTLRTEDEVRAIAARERRLERPEPAMLTMATAGRTGRAAVPARTPGASVQSRPEPAKPALTCAQCGGPRPTTATRLCPACYVPKPLPASTTSSGRGATTTASGLRIGDTVPLQPKPAPRPTPRPAAAVRPASPKAPLHSTDLGVRPKVVWLGLELLHVDRTYQREIGERGTAHINRIVAAFNWNCYQPIVVSARDDGRYAVIDGQHRLEAARRHPLIDELPCYVIQAPDVAAQARIFVSLNTDRLSLTSQHKFWAAHAAGEPAAVSLVGICEAAGVKVLRSPPSGTAPPLSLLAPMVGQTLIRRYGEAPVREAINLLAKAQPTTPMAFRAHFLVALTRIAGDRAYSRDRALAVLAKADLQKLHIEAMAKAPGAGGGGRAGGAEAVLRRLLGIGGST